VNCEREKESVECYRVERRLERVDERDDVWRRAMFVRRIVAWAPTPPEETR